MGDRKRRLKVGVEPCRELAIAGEQEGWLWQEWDEVYWK